MAEGMGPERPDPDDVDESAYNIAGGEDLDRASSLVPAVAALTALVLAVLAVIYLLGIPS